MGESYRYLKFRKVNEHLIESLVNRTIFFSSPNKLNDPFDCRIVLDGAFKRATRSTTGRHLQLYEKLLKHRNKLKILQDTLQDVGICSFSIDIDSIISNHILWSHYAEKHRGVCLIYSFDDDFIRDENNGIIGRSQVTYGDDKLTNWLIGFKDKTRCFPEEFTKIYWTVKSHVWEYEKEVRLVRNATGVLTIPSGSIEQICFGLDTPPEQIALIQKLAADYAGCRSFARMVPEDSDFGMRLEKME